MINEKTVCNLLRNGDTKIFEEIYNTYYPTLNRYSFHIVMCEHSHDIVQEVFTKLWSSRKKLPLDLDIKSYLYRSVKNGSLNYLKHLDVIDDKKNKIIESTLFINDSWNDNEEEPHLFDRVYSIVETLPTQQQKILKLKFEGKSYKDISEELNISVKTVNNHIVKSYTIIRNILVMIFFSLFN